MHRSSRTILHILTVTIAVLVSAPAAAQPVFQGATWSYRADGVDLGTVWRAPAYPDGSWPSGAAVLGYGETYIHTAIPYGPDANNKYRTTYFRHVFDLGVDPVDVLGMTMSARYDDGFVAYLNGQEIARRSMPGGEITYDTFGFDHEAGGYESIDLGAYVGLLVNGTNVLAVEVHQATPSSVDLVWDASFTCSTDAPQVTRGPYLQSVTTGSAVVRWRTDRPTDSEVRYGLEGQPLWGIIRSTVSTTEHEITVPWLSPATRYDYAVGSRNLTLAGGDPEHYFLTAPAEASGAVRLWVVGDAGTADADAVAVRDAYLAYAADEPADLWLSLGDNAYYSGTDEEYQAAIFDMYAGLLAHMPMWSARGNHDKTYPDPTPDYYTMFTLPSEGEAGGMPSHTEAYYSMDYRDVHLVCLDSEGSDRSPGGTMLTWLAADLAATDKDWVIAYFHHCPYTKSNHDSDDPYDSEGKMFDVRENFLPVLEAGGVDLVLNGHAHDYERSFLLDGHYGASNTLTSSMIRNGGDGRMEGDGPYRKPPGRTPHAGTVYVVAGSSGKMEGEPGEHPAMAVSLDELGSVVIDVEGPRLDGRFLDDQGVVRDSFTIAKDLPLGVPVAGIADLPALGRAHPNPFASSTRLGFTLPRAGEATLRVLDVSGRQVRTLAEGAWATGAHVVAWDGRDALGAAVSAGVYFAVLEADGRRVTQRIVRVE